MSTKTVTPDQVYEAVVAALAKYGDKVFDKTAECAKKASRQTSKELKATSPRVTGKYASGWTHKKQTDGVAHYSEIVYNRKRYMLVHLLEKPHATGRYRGGRYPKKVDHTGLVARVDAVNTEKFLQEVMAKL